MKTIIITIALLASGLISAQQEALAIEDLMPLNDTQWTGQLTYRNYSDNKEVSLPSTLKVSLSKKTVIMEIAYPNEPKANTTNRIQIKKGGLYFGKEKVLTVERTDNTLSFTTHFMSLDNGEKVNTRKKYRFNENELQIVKTIYPDNGEPFVRNRFQYKKDQ